MMIENRTEMEKKFLGLLHNVIMPGRYVGGEWNEVKKDPDAAAFRTVLCFPDVYEVGMSHLGLIILYHLLNESPWHHAERCFAPWPDMGQALREKGIPLLSLESRTPLSCFDLVGFSLQHELLYTNVLYMLELAGIPLRSEERGEDDPIVIAGGCGALTPEPLAEAIDLFLPGDGEEALPALASLFRELKAEGADRREKLLAAAQSFPFAYVPAFYEERGDADGPGRTVVPRLDGAPPRIIPAVALDLENAYFPDAPILSGVRTIHDRIAIEIMRGCLNGCRFCQAGATRRPLRRRSPGKVIDLAESIYGKTGCDSISLLSLSSSEYPGIEELMIDLNARFEERRVGLSLPSLRVDDRLKSLPELAGMVRKSGLTLAPEVATDSLRRRINKNITNHDLLEGVVRAYDQGWTTVKLYFMIGLPGETEDDVLAIGRLARRIASLRGTTRRGATRVNVSISTFIPKPHTPFQWSAMARPEEVAEKRRLLLRMKLPSRIRLKFHDRRMTLVEAMLARGGRNMFAALCEARARHCSFDAWTERIDIEGWQQALTLSGVNPEIELYRERAGGESLPWDHIVPGPSKEFLALERERAASGETTPCCGEEACNSCGLDPAVCAKIREPGRE